MSSLGDYCTRVHTLADAELHKSFEGVLRNFINFTANIAVMFSYLLRVRLSRC